jgi:hypothetical protein
MEGRLVALLVAIDEYVAPLNPLHGCRNDIAALSTYLHERTDRSAQLDLVTLVDEEATRDAVVTAFREHLGRAGPGDVALFAYAGHGSEEPAALEVAHLEPTGRIQTLVLHDCGRRIGGTLRRGLADKELSLLIAEVAAKGPHVVVVLDCCHSGGATRDPVVAVRGWSPEPELAPAELRDLVTELTEPRPLEAYLPGTMEHWSAPAARHVVLSACRSSEKAKELRIGEATRGAFSIALVEALSTLGSESTYRSVLTAARAHVERITEDQRPELFPLDPGSDGDALFLDGTITAVPAAFTMTLGRSGWEIDGGAVHGLRAPVGDEAFTLACTRPDAAPGEVSGIVRVTDVDIGRSQVEPIGWTPADPSYRVIVAGIPLPPAVVAFDLPCGDVPEPAVADVVDRVTRALETSGPGGGPSPYLTTSTETAPVMTALRVGVPSAGMARIARQDGTAVTTDTAVSDEDGARLVVARLEHIARWEQVRALGDHPSPLRGAVTIEVFEAADGERFRPHDRQPISSTGAYHLSYRMPDGGSPQPPRVFIEVCNVTDEALWVAVLDLTDRFRCHAVLPTVALAAGHRHALADGAVIPVSLPTGRPVESGATARDWMKVIVSDVDFDATVFDLAALDEPPAERSVTRAARPLSTLERLATKVVTRGDAAVTPDAVSRWAASTVLITTAVP